MYTLVRARVKYTCVSYIIQYAVDLVVADRVMYSPLYSILFFAKKYFDLYIYCMMRVYVSCRDCAYIRFSIQMRDIRGARNLNLDPG